MAIPWIQVGSDTRESFALKLHRGINIHFVGILLSLLVAQLIVGSLVLKVLTLPSDGVID